MISLFKTLIDIITSVLEFVGHTIYSLFVLLSHIPEYVSFIVSSINVLPNVIVPFAIASISIYVVFLILGRNS